MNVFEAVTDSILERLSQGVIPWRTRWTAGTPKSFIRRREYRGINLILLSLKNRTSRYWITYREAQRIGGQVRRGEKGSPVVYWHWRTAAEMDELIASGKSLNPAPCVPFMSVVFNLDQVDGVERPEDDILPNEEGRVSRAEAIIDGMKDKPKIVHGLNHHPAYSPFSDTIRIPYANQFESADLYYTNLFHELVHSTGHESRLNRFGERKSPCVIDDRYSFEELIAEFGSAFLCRFSGIENSTVLEDSASYIASWSKVFRNDKGILIKAASAAQKAVDFIQGAPAHDMPAHEETGTAVL